MKLAVEGTLSCIISKAGERPLITIKMVWPGGFTQNVIVEITQHQFESIQKNMKNMDAVCTFSWRAYYSENQMMITETSTNKLIVETVEDRVR